MAIGWAIIVVLLLIVACLPFFLGILVVLPVLGHTTWHLYRKIVDRTAEPKHPVPPIEIPANESYVVISNADHLFGSELHHVTASEVQFRIIKHNHLARGA